MTFRDAFTDAWREPRGFNSSLEALSDMPLVSGPDEAMRRFDMQTAALCDDILNGRL